MAEYADTARQAVEEQLANLREEVKRLEAAAAALAKGDGAVRRGPGRPRGSGGGGRPRGTATSSRGGARRGRRRGSGTRAAEALNLVKSQPGITIPELAEKMGIKQNYLYRVMPGLQADKQVTKKGKGWHPA